MYLISHYISLLFNNLWAGFADAGGYPGGSPEEGSKWSFKDRQFFKEAAKILKIAIYGKGGIGKSTTTSNVSAALALKGYRVMQIGCDPKADSVKNLLRGKRPQTVLDMMRTKGNSISLDDIVYEGFAGVMCVESGGPMPGAGCAGRGIITAFQKLADLKAFDYYKPDVVLYDVLGDVVCGGFTMPIREGYASDVYIVSSGEAMSLYAACNIASAVRNFGKRGYARVAGLIMNSKNIPDELAKVNEALPEIGTKIVQIIPRSADIQLAEAEGATVFEALESSAMKDVYNSLADYILEEGKEELCRN